MIIVRLKSVSGITVSSCKFSDPKDAEKWARGVLISCPLGYYAEISESGIILSKIEVK